MTTRWNNRQMLAVQDLEVAPDASYEMVAFNVDDCGRSLFVSRSYVPTHARSVRYTEGFRVGPHGSVKRLYRTF